MAKGGDKPEEKTDESIEKEKKPKVSQDILLVCHKAITTGYDISRYRNWSGIVKINKKVRLRVTGKDGKTKILPLPGKEPFSCSLRELMKLTQRAMLEGSAGMLKKWCPGEGKARCKPDEKPLTIEIMEQGKTTFFDEEVEEEFPEI